MNQKIRPAAVAGMFYTSDPPALHKQIQGFFATARVDPPGGDVVGLISPHAGLVYSGLVAAHGYKLLHQNQFDTVIIVGPSHHVYFEGHSVYWGSAYQMPFGPVPLDQELIADLMAHESSIMHRPDAHTREHALEVQLPFLQEVLGEFKLVPIVMGNQTRANWQQLAQAISKTAADKNVLLVASTDLSHFYDYDTAVHLDHKVLESIDHFDPDALWEKIESKQCEACGAGPMVSIMQAAKELGAHHARVLNYANSGDVSGDHSRVVGYASAVLYR